MLATIYVIGFAVMLTPTLATAVHVLPASAKSRFGNRELVAILFTMLALWPLFVATCLFLGLRWMAPGWVSLFRHIFPTKTTLPRAKTRTKEEPR